MIRLTYETAEGSRSVLASTVVLTVPAYVAADLLGPRFPKLAAALGAIEYPPVAGVVLSYPLSAIRADRLGPNGDLQGTVVCVSWCGHTPDANSHSRLRSSPPTPIPPTALSHPL